MQAHVYSHWVIGTSLLNINSYLAVRLDVWYSFMLSCLALMEKFWKFLDVHQKQLVVCKSSWFRCISPPSVLKFQTQCVEMSSKLRMWRQPSIACHYFFFFFNFARFPVNGSFDKNKRTERHGSVPFTRTLQVPRPVLPRVKRTVWSFRLPPFCKRLGSSLKWQLSRYRVTLRACRLPSTW